jgi:hypothetical protein
MGDIGQTAYLGCESDLRANLRRLGIGAGLDQDEWAVPGEVVQVRLELELDGADAEERVMRIPPAAIGRRPGRRRPTRTDQSGSHRRCS